MNKSKFTPEQKKAYFQALNESWRKTKDLSETEKCQAIIAECFAQGVVASERGIAYVWEQMERLGFEGLPHIDCKTLKYWKEAGYRLKNNQSCLIKGITFKKITSKKENEGKSQDEKEAVYSYPKVYNLFHSSQVEPI